MDTDKEHEGIHHQKALIQAIDEAISGKAIAKGLYAKVFRFKDPLLTDYVVRASVNLTPKMLGAVLRQTSSLSTPALFPQGVDIGQFLVAEDGPNKENPAIAIMRYIPGQSVEALIENDLRTFPKMILESYKKNAINPFKQLLSDAYSVIYAGYNLDSSLANIIYNPDSGKMTLIDQRVLYKERPSQQQALENTKNYANELKSMFKTDEDVLIDANQESCLKLIDDAMDSLHKNYHSLSSLSFGTVTSTSAIALSTKTSQVKQQLDALYNQSRSR